MTGSKNVKRNAVPRNPVKHDIIRGASYTRRIRFRSRNCSGNPFRDKDTCSQVFLRSAASVESTKKEREREVDSGVGRWNNKLDRFHPCRNIRSRSCSEEYFKAAWLSIISQSRFEKKAPYKHRLSTLTDILVVSTMWRAASHTVTTGCLHLYLSHVYLPWIKIET